MKTILLILCMLIIPTNLQAQTTRPADPMVACQSQCKHNAKIFAYHILRNTPQGKKFKQELIRLYNEKGITLFHFYIGAARDYFYTLALIKKHLKDNSNLPSPYLMDKLKASYRKLNIACKLMCRLKLKEQEI